MAELKKTFTSLIKAGHFRPAITLLERYGESDDLLQNDLIQISANYSSLEADQRRDVLEQREIRVGKAKISQALISLSEEIPDGKTISLTPETQLLLQNLELQKKAGRFTWLLGAIIYLVIASGVAVWLFGKQGTYDIKAEILVDQLGFEYVSGTSFLPDESMERVGILYFSEITLPAQSLRTNNQTITDPAGGSPLTIQPIDISGVDPEVRFYNVGLDQLSPTPGSKVLIERPSEENPSSFLLKINKEAASNLVLSFQDSVRIEGNDLVYSEFPGVGAIDTSNIWVRYPGSAKEIQIEGIPQQFIVTFKGNKTVSLSQSDLTIKGLKLYKEHEDQPISSVLGATIWVKEPGSDEAIEPAIQAGKTENLSILSEEALAMTALEFSQDGILMKLEGTVSDIQTGRTFSSRSPARWEWLWHNQKALLIGIGIIMIGLLFFVPMTVLNRIKAVKETVS